MAILENTASYQGLLCKSVRYSRSEGLEPDYGQVVISRSQIGQILIKDDRGLPWRAVNGTEADAGTTPEIFTKVGTTVTKPAEIKTAKGGGLNRFGDLVCQSSDGAGNARMPVRFRDIYVAAQAVIESSEDRGDVLEHAAGDIVVQITDIRSFYRHFGYIAVRVNVKLSDGDWDPRTLDPDTAKPWKLRKILNWLFSQLPGSPAITRDGIPDTDSPEIIAEHEPAAQVLGKILDEMALVARMQPDNNYWVHPRWTAFPRLTIANGLGKQRGVTDEDELAYEREAATPTDRPAVIEVVGKRRVARVSAAFVNVVINERERIELIDAFVARIGYSMAQVKRQALVHGRPFDDLGVQGAQHAIYRDILRMHAYRTYAPAFLFAGGKSELTSRDYLTSTWLPMVPAAWSLEELEELQARGFKMPTDTPAPKGDRGAYKVVPPVVYARTIDTGLVRRWPDVVARYGELEVGFANKDAQLKSALAMSDAKRTARLKELAKLEAGLSELTTPVHIDKNREVTFYGKGLGEHQHAKTVEALTERIAYISKERLKRLEADVDAIKRQIGENAEAAKKAAENFSRMKAAYEKPLGPRGVPLVMNVPHRILSKGYSIEEKSGLIRFSVPACHMEQPFLLDGQTGTVAVDGGVFVTWGWELNTNTPSDFSTVRVAAVEDPGFLGEFLEGGDSVAVVGVSTPTPVKPYIIRAPDLRIYQAELGSPFNLKVSIETAFKLAKPLLLQPIVQTGYTMEFTSFVECWLCAGIQSVQYEWKGGTARTWVQVNAPGARSPLTPARVGRPSDVSMVNARDMIGGAM